MADYSPETERIYRAECMECSAWFVPPADTTADQEKGLRRAKAWARHHMDEEHSTLDDMVADDIRRNPGWGRDDEPAGDQLYVQIARVIGNVA